MWSLLLVLVYQISSGSGSSLAASIIPARHGKAIRVPWVSSIPTRGYMSWQSFPHWNPLIKPLGLSLQGFPEVISLPRPKRWVSRVSSIRCLTGGKLGPGVRKGHMVSQGPCW